MDPVRLMALCVLSLVIAVCESWGTSQPAAVADSSAFRARQIAHIGGSATDVVVRGEIAYVGYAGELAVIDIADVAHPERIGYVMLSANDLAMRGKNVLVAGKEGLSIVDIGTPTTPRVVGRLDTSLPALGVSVADDLAYVVTTSGGLHVVDLHWTRHPVQIGYVPIESPLPDVEAVGKIAYVATNHGLHVVDVSEPHAPEVVSMLEIPGFAADLTIEGDRLFLTNEFAGLVIIDIGDPLRPSVLQSVAVNTMVWDVAVVDDVAYVGATEPGLHVIRNVRSSEPVIVSLMSEPASLWALTVQDGRLFGVNMDGDLHVIDIADAFRPTATGTYDAPGYSVKVAATDAHAYVVGDGDGAVYEISLDERMQLATRHLRIAPDRTVALAATDDGGFVASGEGTALWAGVRTEGNDLRSEPLFPAGWSLHEVSVSGDRLYGVGGEAGLLWLEEPSTKPLRHGRFPLAARAPLSVDAQDGYVYAGGEGLTVFAHPPGHAPKPSAHIETPGPVDTVRVDADNGFVIVDTSRLCALELVNPSRPALAGCVDLPASAATATLYDEHAYVALGKSGIVAINLAVPSQPEIVWRIQTFGHVLDVAAANGGVYVADAAGGVLFIRMSSNVSY